MLKSGSKIRSLSTAPAKGYRSVAVTSHRAGEPEQRGESTQLAFFRRPATEVQLAGRALANGGQSSSDFPLGR
jgi:hypothetical protein